MPRTADADLRAMERAVGAALDLAGHLDRLAGGMTLAAGDFPAPSPAWAGPAAQALARALAARPQAFRQVGQAARHAAAALTDHADTLLLAARLMREAESSPEPLATELHRRARAMAEQGGAEVADRLLALARLAPARPAAVARAIDRVRDDQAQAWLVAGEAARVGVSLASRAASRLEHWVG